MEKTDIPGLVIVSPKCFDDHRGWFLESYHKEKYEDVLELKHPLLIDNESYSHKHVLRGLHLQLPPYSQSKLVRVAYGEILDVAVDLRLDSSTFGKWFSIKLSHGNKKQLWIPREFAHGFLVLSEFAIVEYKCDNEYIAGHGITVKWDDPEIGIDWRLNNITPNMSSKDEYDGITLHEYKELVQSL